MLSRDPDTRRQAVEKIAAQGELGLAECLAVRIGCAYRGHRQGVMLTRQEGLTDTYSRFDDGWRATGVPAPCTSSATVQRQLLG